MKQIIDPPTMKPPHWKLIGDRLFARIERQHDLLKEMNQWAHS